MTPDEVVWSYAGVRPLYDDANRDVSAVTRDYVLDLDAPEGEAPLLSVFGGKITTYRKLAEHALAQLQPLLGLRARRLDGGATLPGGDLPNGDFDAFLRTLQRARPWLPAALARRYARAYGTRVERAARRALAGSRRLGEPLGDGLYEAEVDYLVREEWARDRRRRPVPPLQARSQRRRPDPRLARGLARASQWRRRRISRLAGAPRNALGHHKPSGRRARSSAG